MEKINLEEANINTLKALMKDTMDEYLLCNHIEDEEKRNEIFEYMKEIKKEINKKFKLKPEWCEFSDETCEFYSYPSDNECSCGVHKHHVHCIHGGIIQTG